MKKSGMFILSLILLLGVSLFVSASCADSQKVFNLYQENNSHVSEYNYAPYTLSACSNIVGDRSCKAGNNNVLFYKYQDNNSHVSVNADSYYTIPVCYGEFSCHSVNNAPCNTGEVIVASLYQTTNSHISLGNDSNYPIKICCSNGVGYISLENVSEVYWTNQAGTKITKTQNNSLVNITLVGNFTEGKKFDYEIYAQKLLWGVDFLAGDTLVSKGSHIISNIEATKNKSFETSWTALWNESANANTKYYFKIKTDTQEKRSEILEVTKETVNLPTRTSIYDPADKDIFLQNENMSLKWKVIEQHYPIKNITYIVGEGARINGSLSDRITLTGGQDYLLNAQINLSYSVAGQKEIILLTTDALNNVWESRSSILVAKEGLNTFAYISKPKHLSDAAVIDNKVQFSAAESFVINLTKVAESVSISCVLGKCPDKTKRGISISNNLNADLKALKSSNANFIWVFESPVLKIEGKGTDMNIVSFDLIQTPGVDKSVKMNFSYLDSKSKTSNKFNVFSSVIYCLKEKGQVTIQQFDPNSRVLTILGTESYDCTNDGCCNGYECNFATKKCEPGVRYLCYEFNESKQDCETNTKNNGVAENTVFSLYEFKCGQVVAQNGSCVETVENCECVWNSSSKTCGVSWGLESTNCGNSELYSGSPGHCKTSSGQTTGSCDETGLITYTWNSFWTWANGNEIRQYDPSGLNKKCVSGSNSIPCPAQLKLPFFGIVGFIVAIFCIFGIYYSFSKKKK